MVRFACLTCGKVYKAEGELAGKETVCKRCGTRMVVPGPVARDWSPGDEPPVRPAPPPPDPLRTVVPDPGREPEPTPSSRRSVRLLRRLILIEAAATALFVPVALFGALVVEMVARQRGEVTGPAPEVESLVGAASCCFIVVWLPLSIVSWLGLYHLRPWARPLYLALSVVSVAFALAVGVIDFSTQWGLVGALSQASGMLSGAILAMAYYSPAAGRFGRV